MKKIVFFDVKEYEIDYLNSLQFDNVEILKIEGNFQDKFDENYELIKDADAVSVFTDSRIASDNIRKLPSLKLITTRSTGFSHIDTDFCKELGIQVVNVPKYGNKTVAEYSFALLLSVARKVKISSDDLKNNKIIPEKYIGIDLFDKKIGVIGTGAIGSHFCQIANGFGMEILAYDPYPKKELTEKYGVKYCALNDLLKYSDIISVHAPSTASNIHMIDDDQFKIMKDGVILVNTARGELINTKALYRALESKKVAGAGLDVLECEELLAPNSKFLEKVDCKKQSCLEKAYLNNKLLTMENLVITPHMAYDTKGAIKRILSTTEDNIKSFFDGKIKNSVL